MARWWCPVVIGVMLTASCAAAAPPGWRLVWNDDFASLNERDWELVESFRPTNNSRHAYLPAQVSVNDGRLVILSENEPAGELPYRSGQVISKRAQRLGRWEVRARLPATRGMWPAIWLLPDTSEHRWPSQGEIDIMENRGNQPTITSSAFHYGTLRPYRHDFVFHEQQTSLAGRLVSYPDDFHTYAVDWEPEQLRFYVDDVHHFTVHDEDVGGFLSRQSAPMRLMINTAVGGDYLPNPNKSTVWPQRFLVDWVRVYEREDNATMRALVNGSFEANDGSLAGWTVFGNRVVDNPNVLVERLAARDGDSSLKLFGQYSGSENYSGVSQAISVAAGRRVRASVGAFVRSDDSIAETQNRVLLKVEFYDRPGGKFDSPALIGVEEKTIADGRTESDVWNSHELVAEAPAGAVEARVAIVFAQPSDEAGAVHVDAVEFGVIER